MWSIHTGACYSAVKRKEALIHGRSNTTLMNLENTMQSEGSQTQKVIQALAGVAQWTEHQPENRKVTSLILDQGTWLGCMQEATSPCFFPSLFPLSGFTGLLCNLSPRLA